MVKFDWLGERLREKDKWRCASVEYGVQCVLMDRMNSKLLLILSVVSLDMEILVSD